MRGFSLFIAASVLGVCSSAASAAANFEFIYDTTDYPGGLTGDGSKAVISVGSGAAIWTGGGGTPLQPVAGLPGYQFTLGAAISADGTTVVGRSQGIGQTQRAYRWTAGGAQPIGDALGNTGSEAWAVSADGSVVVGSVVKPINYSDAWRWTAATGAQRLAGYGAYNDSAAQGVSADGSVIVGNAGTLLPGTHVSHAFRWTEAGGFQLLTEEVRTWAWGVSGDGSTIVGSGEFLTGNDPAYRWTEARGFERFDHAIEDFRADVAIAASWDGSVVVGQGQWQGNEEAWMWDEQHGVRRLTELAAEMGADLGGQILESATAISSDGTIIAGRSWGPQGGIGYIMVVPEPSSCTIALSAAVAAAMMRRRRSAH